MLKRQGLKEKAKKTRKGGRVRHVVSCRSPMYPSNDALYMDVKKILRSAWEAKAAREGKTFECVLEEEVRRAIELGADAGLEKLVKSSLLRH